MKGLLKKNKTIRFILSVSLFVLFLVLSPISSKVNYSKAADPVKIYELSSMQDEEITQWVTEDALSKFSIQDWTPTGITKMVDPSQIPTGYIQNATGSSWLGIPEKIAGYIIKSILAVVYLVLWVVYSILYGITRLSENILEMVLDPIFVSKEGYLGGFTTKAFVRNAAQLLANLCNMLYLFILIYIGLKTMIGGSFGEKISTRNVLTKLIIAALLTNFGLVFAGVIIDFAQVIMYTVWDGIKGSSETFNPGTKILDQLQKSLGAGRAISQVDSVFGEALKFITLSITYVLTEIIKIAGLIVMSLALVVTLISITVILMIRVFALWILLILTPVAFLFSILPQTNKYWNSWLDALTKYAFTGPILIFFLWLAIKLSATLHKDSDDNGAVLGLKLPGGTGGTLGNLNGGGGGDLKYIFYEFVSKNLSIIFEMGVVVCTIWAGIIIANKFGIKGAKSFDGLIKSTTGLGKGLANYIPWYGGRAATWGSLLVGKVASGYSQKRSTQAELARSFGETTKAENLDKKAKWWSDKETSITNRKNQIIKGFSVMNPMILKKQFAAWWNKNSKEHMEQSEASVDEFGKDFVRAITFGKLVESGKSKMSAEAKINNLNKNFIEKYNKLQQAETDFFQADTQFNTTDSINQPRIASLNNLIQQLDSRIKTKNQIIDNYRQKLKNPIGLPKGVTEDILRDKIKKEEINKQHLEDEKSSLKKKVNEISSATQKDEEDRDTKKTQVDKVFHELRELTFSLAEMSTKDEKEKISLIRKGDSLISNMNGPLPNDYTFTNALDAAMGFSGKNTLLEKSKELAKDNSIELMTDHIWQKEKKEKAVKEKLKDLEDKRYTFEELEDMAKSGYGDSITRTAIFRKLASSPKNFANLLEKTLKDYNRDEKKALDFLKQRYSEDELKKAFSAAETEARKSNNMFAIGWLKHDSTIGKLRFSMGNERNINLAGFAKGMTPDNINKIHPQSFNDTRAIEQMAKNFDWVKLARNPRFIDSMSQNTRMLFKGKQAEFENHMSQTNKDAFRQIIKV